MIAFFFFVKKEKKPYRPCWFCPCSGVSFVIMHYMWFTEGQELGWRSGGVLALVKEWGEGQGKGVVLVRNSLSPLVQHPWMRRSQRGQAGCSGHCAGGGVAAVG